MRNQLQPQVRPESLTWRARFPRITMHILASGGITIVDKIIGYYARGLRAWEDKEPSEPDAKWLYQTLKGAESI